MSEELKPCPFCGSKPNWCGDGPSDPHLCHQIVCDCGIQIDASTKQAQELETMDELRTEMVRLWNDRSITLDQAKQVLAEAGMVAVPVDDMTEIAKFVKCGIGGNYGGIYYTEKLREVYFPLLSSIEAAQEKPDA